MKVLVIGATGAVGLPLASQLVERGHEVVGTSRTQERAQTLRKLRAEPAVLDLLDREAVRRLVLEFRPDAMRATIEAVKHNEAAVLDAGGIALRYGSFYGAAIDPMRDAVRERKVPIVGDGDGVWSLVHVADAAGATVLALERGAPGVYNVADDEPAPVREVLPVMAEALGARPPRKVPAWLARLFAGEIGVIIMTQIRGISNAKAKRELGWTLRYPTWRDGFPATYGLARAA
jgi:nucleoside-diphosphate-sugar epimerase